MAVKFSRSGTWRVRKCDVSGSAMFVIRSLRRVRKNHGLRTSRVAYHGKSGLWYLTARAVFCLNEQINTRSSFLFTRKLRMFKSTMREDLCWTYILMPSSVFCSESYIEACKSHVMHSSISYRCLHLNAFSRKVSVIHLYDALRIT